MQDPPRYRYFFKEWREFRGLSQQELAERIGSSIPTISHIETGKNFLTRPTLEALADALRCQPGELLSQDPHAMQRHDRVPKSIVDLFNDIEDEQARSDAERVVLAVLREVLRPHMPRSDDTSDSESPRSN